MSGELTAWQRNAVNVDSGSASSLRNIAIVAVAVAVAAHVVDDAFAHVVVCSSMARASPNVIFGLRDDASGDGDRDGDCADERRADRMAESAVKTTALAFRADSCSSIARAA